MAENQLVTKSFAAQCLAFPSRVEAILAEIETVEDAKDVLDQAATMQHYADRLKAGVEIERPIALGVLKIKAKLGELLPAGKGGRGKKKPDGQTNGFNRSTIAAYRKIAAHKELLDEYYEAIDDVPSQSDFLKIVAHSEKTTATETKAAEHAKAAKAAARKLKRESAPLVYHEPFTATAERIESDSVALIFTDPPYDTESVPMYGDLARVASRVLVDGGSLICYCGHRLIPKIIEEMKPSGLSFYWILACIHSGKFARMPLTGQIVTWKPMLWWIKGKERRNTAAMLNDSVVSDPPDKETHDWQQGITEALYYIEHLTEKGELVFEPFCGGGTTIIAARQLGRITISCDVDATSVAKSIDRIEKAGLA